MNPNRRCVLVYLAPEEGAALVRCLGGLLPCAAFVVYEQIGPGDAFGRQMVLNLEVGMPAFRIPPCTKVSPCSKAVERCTHELHALSPSVRNADLLRCLPPC